MKKRTAIIIGTIMMFSCKQPITVAVTNVRSPVDSLITVWSNSWNNHDSAGVSNMFAQDALLIDDDLIANNTEEIAAKWIHPNINAVNHFKTTRLQDWSANNRAGYTAKYEFDVIVKDSIVARPHGIYTVNWVKAENGKWKITTAVIHGLR